MMSGQLSAPRYNRFMTMIMVYGMILGLRVLMMKNRCRYLENLALMFQITAAVILSSTLMLRYKECIQPPVLITQNSIHQVQSAFAICYVL